MENENPDIKKIISNIAKTPFFKSIFIVSLIIAIILPLYGIFYVMPSFTNQVIKNIEAEAFRTATHIRSMLFHDNNFELDTINPEDILKEIDKVRRDFQFEKIKFLSSSGEIVFSTTKQDIGLFNDNDYFHYIVAKGEKYLKIVEQDAHTSDGRSLKQDIAVIYLPILQGGKFIGAFEVYYDITAQKKDADLLLMRFSLAAILTSLVLLLLVVIMLFKASKTDIERKKAEQALKEANDSLEERVAEQTHEIELTQEMSIESLSILAEYYDLETGAHLERIQSYVYLLINYLKDYPPYSELLQANRHYIKNITLASVLHDIGKTAIPIEILTKPSDLTDEEFDIMKKHTEIAGEILDNANRTFVNRFNKDSYLALARDIALYHHERWDGKGYPHGLKGKEIPFSARIVSIVDVYDALRSRRYYKAPLSHKEAVNEILKGKGLQFAPVIVDAFMANSAQFEAISSEYYHKRTSSPFSESLNRN